MRSLGLRILVELNRARGVTYPKDAIEEMQFPQTEAVKERIAPQQRLYREAVAQSLLPIDRIKTDRCSVPLPKVRPAGDSRCVPKNRVLRFL